MSKGVKWSMVTVLASGISIYLVLRMRRLEQQRRLKRREKYLTDVYSHSKRHGGAEFVL
jgi:hypothetical protein